MTLVIDTLELGPIRTNCYLVRSDRGSAEAVVVDPSGDASEIRLELARAGARCAGILITHGHWDHLLGVADLAEGTGAPVYMPEGERMTLEDPTAIFGSLPVLLRPYTPDVTLSGGEKLELGGIVFSVVAVPGHSPAHLAYHTEECLFSGDVLFAGGVGRADLPGADWNTLLASIRALADAYPPETTVYPGHGPPTTLGRELADNPFLAELRVS